MRNINYLIIRTFYSIYFNIYLANWTTHVHPLIRKLNYFLIKWMHYYCWKECKVSQFGKLRSSSYPTMHTFIKHKFWSVWDYEWMYVHIFFHSIFECCKWIWVRGLMVSFLYGILYCLDIHMMKVLFYNCCPLQQL